MKAPGKVKVSGFCDTDKYANAVMKGAEGVCISTTSESLELLVSGGLVTNCTLQGGREQTLEQYTIEIGGVQIRSEKIFGIYNPLYISENVICNAK